MSEIVELLKAYKDYGAGAIFMALYIVTIVYFYKELKENKAETAKITERVVTALDKSSESIERTVQVLSNVGKSLDQNTKETAEFIAFVRGRDSVGRTN